MSEGYYESGDTWPHEDNRWPILCANCGRPFKDNDKWSLLHERLYYWDEEGVEITLSEAKAGALWGTQTPNHSGTYPGPDGLYLYVRLPNGKDWFIDGPSKGEKSKGVQAWSRTGEFPNITVDPGVISVNENGLSTLKWEGRITNGHLVKKK